MEELKEYHDVGLIASEVDFLEQIEKLIGEEIPCRENRDETKKQIAQAYQPQQVTAQSVLQAQYRSVKAQQDQMDQLSQMSSEQLEKYYETQFLAQVNPQAKASIQMQLNTLLPVYGAEHPSIKQLKEALEMDEEKAKVKAKSFSRFMEQNFKLQAINKDATRRIYEKMYSQISLNDLESECKVFYKTMITPEYQAQLKGTIEVGIQALGEDHQNLAGLKPLLGMDENSANLAAKQYAAQMHQSIQSILQQYGIQQQSQQESQQQAQQEVIQSVSAKSASVSHFGYICEDKHIIGLNIGWKNLETLPASIGNLSRLRFLDLAQNKLEQLPDTFGNVKALEELNLTGSWSTNDDKPLANEISTLPDSFCELKNLKILKIEENGLRELPQNFGQLSSLIELNLKTNRISQIPDSIGNLSELKNLWLRSNRISSIPNSLCRLEKLKDLDLSFNSIIQIPDCIGQLKSLWRFYIDGNSISEIPPSIANLNTLEVLHLNKNRISNIPEEITKLKLNELGLENNQLSMIPYFIWTMNSLLKLKLGGNLFSEEEKEIAQRDAQAILDYCRQRASIAVMIINTEEDAEAHRLPELISFLEGQSEIFAVISGDETQLPATDLIIFLATAGSIKSSQCVNLLKTAKTQGIDVIPLKGLDIGWGDLSIIDLSRELGHEFTPDDFNGFCDRVYSYIQQIKRTHNIFKDKSAIFLRKAEQEIGDPSKFVTFKTELSRIINSEDMRAFYEQFKTQITSYYNNTLDAKINREPLFLSQALYLFPVYMQQKQFSQQQYGGVQK